MYALYVLSKDNWKIKFIRKRGLLNNNMDWKNKDGTVLLFSGGMDSFCAAVDFLKTKEDIVLVSHITHGNRVVEDSQKKLYKLLEDHFQKNFRHIQIKVYGRNINNYTFPKHRENTQRTRSFIFLTLGALVTRRVGFNRVLYMAENGQFAIHLPLNNARIGPFSTHTADPEFVNIFQDIIRIIFSNSKFEIINPFIYKTKAEVFSLLPDILKKKSYLSVSCWKISRTQTHCGVCIPCIARRIALEYNNYKFSEYHVDLFEEDLESLSEYNSGKRNLVDYMEFITRFKKISSLNKHELLMHFPELYNEYFDQDKAIDLYQRMAHQSIKVFKSYPKLKRILG
jgi:7-cyano-7-deazaguanine synthase in queuosine biosynthesis